MTRSVYADRNGWKRGDRVRTTERFRKLYPTNRALLGTIIHFCRGTDVRIKFDDLKREIPMDERFLERVDPDVGFGQVFARLVGQSCGGD